MENLLIGALTCFVIANASLLQAASQRETIKSQEQAVTIPNPCEKAAGWRAELCAFAKVELQHSAWGYEHGLRDYMLALSLAQGEGVVIDDDVIFAAAMLHDVGGFAAYEQSGVDHAVRSAQVLPGILLPRGFPADKISLVQKAVVNHSYYDSQRPETPEGVLLHDADALDFLGFAGAARILSVVEREKAAPSLQKAVQLLTSFQKDLPRRLYGGSFTQAMGRERAENLRVFLDGLRKETFNYVLP